MNYYLINKRNLWTIQRKQDRKQMAPGFKLKSEANDYLEKLLAKDAAQTKNLSEFKFKEEWLAYSNKRLLDAQDPNNRLTTGGVQTYIGHYNQRINKYMPDVLLSEFNILVLEKFLLHVLKF